MPSSESDGEGGLDMFQDPEGFYEPEKQPTFASHTMLNGRELSLRLVGHNPLWGHHLWNAGRVLAHFLEEHASTLLAYRTVLELGAGAGLPSMIAAQSNASKVVVTDYPDADLVENLRFNVTHALPAEHQSCISAEGYLWGADPEPLLSRLPLHSQEGFDTLILADLLFNHTCHPQLVASIEKLLDRSSATAQALVFFTPYRPWLLEKDLAFFDLARQAGFVVEKLLETEMEKVMFEEDPGDEKLRRTVFGYVVRWRRQGEFPVDDGHDAQVAKQ